MSSLGPCAIFYSPFIHGLSCSCSSTHNFLPHHFQVCSILAAFISHASLFLQLSPACNTFPWAKLGENETSFSGSPRHVRMLQRRSVLFPAIWKRSMGAGRLLHTVEKGGERLNKNMTFWMWLYLDWTFYSVLSTTAVFLAKLVGFVFNAFI